MIERSLYLLLWKAGDPSSSRRSQFLRNNSKWNEWNLLKNLRKLSTISQNLIAEKGTVRLLWSIKVFAFSFESLPTFGSPKLQRKRKWIVSTFSFTLSITFHHINKWTSVLNLLLRLTFNYWPSYLAPQLFLYLKLRRKITSKST